MTARIRLIRYLLQFIKDYSQKVNVYLEKLSSSSQNDLTAHRRQNQAFRMPLSVASRVDPTHSRIVCDAVYREHICSGARIDIVLLSKVYQFIKARHHLVFETGVHFGL